MSKYLEYIKNKKNRLKNKNRNHLVKIKIIQIIIKIIINKIIKFKKIKIILVK